MVVVSLREIIEELELQSEEAVIYLNRVTGEIVRVSEEESRLVENDEPDDSLPEW